MHLAGSVKSKIMWKFYQRDIWLIAVFICSSMQEVHSRNPPHCSKKMKYSIKDFFSKCDHIRSFLCTEKILNG